MNCVLKTTLVAFALLVAISTTIFAKTKTNKTVMTNINLIEYAILHCSATPEGREYTGFQLADYHLKPVELGGRGFSPVMFNSI